jgi:phosphatidate phosphatase APP1
MNLSPAPDMGQGGGVPAAGGAQTITLPYPTTDQGDFDVFVPLSNADGGLQDGSGEIPAQRLNVYAEGTDTGNATSYLVSNQGLTIISDIDDILRITKIYQPKEGLLNSFARPFVPWRNMPEIYHNWSTTLPNLHFHYLTTTPEQITRNYMQFIYATYPGGSFDTSKTSQSPHSQYLANLTN